jgi:hypothetical protein
VRKLASLSDQHAGAPPCPYVPIGTLRRAVNYPEPARSRSDEEIAKVLKTVGLGDLAGRLDEENLRVISSRVVYGVEYARKRIPKARAPVPMACPIFCLLGGSSPPELRL